MKTCILIGNSSSTLGQGFGSYIDEFENVVRFNRFGIEGYEEDLGKKCTHWVLGYKLAVGKTHFKDYFNNKKLNKIREKTIGLKQALILTINKDEENKIDNIKRKVNIDVVYKNFPKPFGSKPTTGFLAMKYLLEYFPQLTLVGFDFGKSNHYWGNHGIADVPGKHEWGKEKDYIYDLVGQNKIKIL